jgi:hypothetical protein
MGTLQDGLRNVGVASEKQVRESEAKTQLNSEMEAAQRARPAKEREKRLGILRATSSPDTFRSEARKLLLLYPDLIQELINSAHSQGMHLANKKPKGGGRLIANLYQVKEKLQQTGLTAEEKQAAVANLFPKR